MKCRIFLSALVIGLLLFVVGCGQDSPSEVPTEPPQTEIEIIFVADPPEIQSGECVQIIWEVVGAQAGVALNGEDVPPAGNTEVCPETTRIFELAVDADEKIVTRTLEVIVHEGGEPPGAEPVREEVQPDEPEEPAEPHEPVASAAPQEPITPGTPAYQAGSWLRLGGPPGGLGYDIRMQPDNPDIMYVTDAHAGVHKSVDGGLTWFASNTGIDPEQSGIVPIFCLTIDPHDYNTIWAGTQYRGYIYRSTDAGVTWQHRDSGITLEGRSVRGITTDPNNPNVIYAGLEVSSDAWGGDGSSSRMDPTMGEVYKSMDTGATWSLIWTGDNLARYIWVDPRNSNRVYVSTGIFDRDAAHSNVPAGEWGGVGILRSDDGGATWTVLNEANGLGGLYIPSLFMHPENPDILLAGVSGTADNPGAYLTRDGGDSWERLPLVSHGLGIEAVEIAASNTNIWYAAAEGLIWRSNDAGQSWTTGYHLGPTDRESGVPIDLQVDPRDPYRIFDNNYGGGNFLSEDGGETWIDVSKGYTGMKVFGHLGLDPDNPRIVFSNAFRSTDGGLTWTGTMARSIHGGFTFYSLAGGGTGILASGQTGSVWHSVDQGITWEETLVVDLLGSGSNEIQSMRSLAISPSDPNLVYVGFADTGCGEGIEACTFPTTGLYRSQDGGYSWEAVDAPFNGVSILSIGIHPLDSQHIYVGTGIGLYESRDGAGSWQLVENLLLDHSALIAADPGTQFRDQQYPLVLDIEFDPVDPDMIYLATIPGGAWRSTDGGQTWTQIAAGMDANEPVYELVPDPGHPGVWYASSGFSGVFYTTDGGMMWQRLNEGLTNTSVRGMALSQDGSVLYAGTIGSGIFRLGSP